MKNKELQKTEIVKFNQTNIVCPVINNEPYVIAKSIIDGIGLNYDYALHSLKKNERLNTYLCEYKVMFQIFQDIPLSNLGLNFGYTYTVIPVRKVAAWLYSINVNKVGNEAKPLLLKFQEKCDDVLFEYFFGRKELNNKYFEQKNNLLLEKRTLETKIKNLRIAISNTAEGKDLNNAESDLKIIKTKLQRLEQKQFGKIYSLFELPENLEDNT